MYWSERRWEYVGLSACSGLVILLGFYELVLENGLKELHIVQW